MPELLTGLLNRLCPPRPPWAVVLASPAAGAAAANIPARFPFYLPGWRLVTLPVGDLDARQRRQARWAGLRRVPVLYAGQHDMARAPHALRANPCYWLNAHTNCREAWEWHELIRQHVRPLPDLAAAGKRFAAYVARRELQQLGRAYVFGTGPSLARAGERDWSDGVRIVCNTIVRDRELWQHLRPHLIVAADAGYHFGFTRHAAAFRADLRARLQECDALFLYPELFDAVVRRELAGLENRLVPIAEGDAARLPTDLSRPLAFPRMHNVLPRLLSIACALADDVGLWGFDGRAPVDQGFWANSARQAYPEWMPELREAYPAFFEDHVPAQDQNRYMRAAFGDELEDCLAAAEAAGKRFVMLHPTWTETLRRRCPPELRVAPAAAAAAAGAGGADGAPTA